MIDDLVVSLEELDRALKRNTAVNVNGKALKQKALDLGKTYFSEIRPKLVDFLGENEAVHTIDELWQRLIELGHGNNARSSYIATTKGLKKELKRISVSFFTSKNISSDQKQSVEGPTSELALLLATLEKLVPSAATSYRQACQDIVDSSRLSYRGTAAEFREALRETVDHLAPDVSVLKGSNFKLEEGQRGPTVKQKVKYILSERGRNKAQLDTNMKLVELLEELTGAVTRAVYTEASVATHVQKSIEDVKRLKRYIDLVLFDILEIS